ncbi:MAG: 1-acyl-sn-glycerol-3-phosphate acyltransferase [Cytophagaceae bacterium]|nr:1-acyl-sn-glycerol-3-phosphate acyltransferase [Cytophagaceae bacterium]|tara:strand:- start:16931 stop:17722 length:792 start_codon:yes stop_codon:yes gene_type:complete
MLKALAYLLTIIFYIAFLILLLFFQAVQWVCFNFFGYQAHKKSVDYLNFCIMKCLLLMGTRFTFKNDFRFKRNCPHIIVTNHQGEYDIPPIIWYLRRLHPKFISKKELGRGVPSVSYNLRHGGSALIDRKDKEQAIREIKKLTDMVRETNRSIVIFPEGTRSRDGVPSEFARGGLTTLFEALPNAKVIPITIHNSYKLLRWGQFPLCPGAHITHTVHGELAVADHEPLELVQKIQDIILADFPEIRPRKKGPTPINPTDTDAQ